MKLLDAFKAFFKTLRGEPQREELPLNEDHSHLQLLRALQQSGRFIDFLKEDIENYSDAQVGAAVRQIHAECKKSIEDLVTVRPVLNEQEGQKIHVPVGYSASEMKLVGNVKGEPPFEGTLIHRGWKAHKQSLPKSFGEVSAEIISPAEIEIK